jgi:hypothetical protein
MFKPAEHVAQFTPDILGQQVERRPPDCNPADAIHGHRAVYVPQVITPAHA